MKIYFAAPVRAGREERKTYHEMVEILSRFGTVLTKHLGRLDLSDEGEIGLSSREIYERDMNWLREADVVVAEITVPSLGVGYEISKGEEQGKPVLCLKRKNERKLSTMLEGNARITLAEYENTKEIEEAIGRFLAGR